MSQEIIFELKTFLSGRFPALQSELDDSTALLDGGAVDSLGILEIVTFLSERFGVDIDDDEFEPENFATPAAIANLVSRKISV